MLLRKITFFFFLINFTYFCAKICTIKLFSIMKKNNIKSQGIKATFGSRVYKFAITCVYILLVTSILAIVWVASFFN